MVDPISISTAACSVVASIATVSKYLIELKKGVGTVDDELDSLFNELQSLNIVVDNISTCFQTDVFIQASQRFNEHTPTNFFNDVHSHLGHCHRTTERLLLVLSEVSKDGKTGLAWRGLRYYRLDDRQTKIGRIRSQLGSHLMCLNLSLTNIQIFRSMQSDPRDQMAFDQLSIKADKQEDLIKKSNATRADVEKTIQEADELSDDETTMLHDIDSIRQSSIKIRRRVTVDIQQRLSSIAGTERGFAAAYVSEAGMPLTPEKQAGIKQWASLAAVKEKDDPESSNEHLTTHGSESVSATNPGGGGQSKSLQHQRSKSSPDSVVKQLDIPSLPTRTAMDSETFERAITQMLGKAQARKTKSDRPFSDEDFNEIGRLLRQAGKQTWSDRPRTYLILRMLDEVQVMDDFVMLGCKDIHFPYTEDRLPNCLGTGQKQSFLQKQMLVLSPKTADLVRGGPHRHLDGSADAGFTIIRTLGRGGQGVIDQVRSKLTLQEYARKRIHRPRLFAKDKEALRMFENEIHHLKRLEHNHLVRFIGSYTDRKYVGIIMEPVAETDLRRYLSRPVFPEEDLPNLKGFIGCLCAAVQYLHSQNCRHKDLKPGNILIIGNKVYVTDFGIAHGWSEVDHDITDGKPGPYTNSYVAPEVANAKARNMKADIWSLGLVFLDILTVLKRSSLERKKDFFMSEGACSIAAWENRDALDAWIAMLENESTEYEKPVKWIRQMTSEDPSARPDASTLMEDILQTAENGDTYCGICCGEDLESDQTSWRGSDSEAEDEQEAITHNSSLSPSLSPDSGLSGSALDNGLQVKSPAAPSATNIARPKIPRFEWQTQTDTVISNIPPTEKSVAAEKETPYVIELAENFRSSCDPAHPIRNLDSERSTYMEHHSTGQVVRDESATAQHQWREASKQSKTKLVVENILSQPQAFNKVAMTSSKMSDSKHQQQRSESFAPLRSPPTPPIANSTPPKDSDANEHIARTKEYFWSDSPDFESYISDRRDSNIEWLPLLRRAVKPLDTTKTLCTMLHIAAAFENREMAKEVVTAYVQAGAKVNALNFASNVPLQYAAAKDRVDLLDYLLKSNAKASHKNVRKQTALHIAAREQSEGSVAILVQHMSVEQINLKDDCGRSALHEACKSGSLGIAKVLVEAGADVDASDIAGHTPIMCCSFDKSAAFFHYFQEKKSLSQRVDIDQRDSGLVNGISQPSLFMLPSEPEVGVLLGPFGDNGPWTKTTSCQCARCRIVNLVENLLNAEQEHIMRCTCADHLSAITSQLLSDVPEVYKTISECSCKGCAVSRLTCSTYHSALIEPARFCECKNCIEQENCYIADLFSMEFYRGHEYYDHRIERAIPRPCGCIDCKAARNAAAVRMLADAGFTGKKSYRLEPKRAWLWLIDMFMTFASSENVPMVPDVVRDVAILLIFYGVNINTADNNSNTLLHVVAASGNLAMASLLITTKALLNIEDRDGETALTKAMFYHRPEMVRLLLREGAEIDKQTGGTQRPRAPVLHEATRLYGAFGYFLPILLAHKPNVNIEDLKFQTPLQWSIYHRNGLPLRLLIETGEAYIELVTRAAPRPLVYAMAMKAPELVRMLVAYGAIVHAKGTEPSAIHSAANLAAGESILVLLESSDALEDLDRKDLEKRTPLHVLADREPKPDVTLAVEAMIAAGAPLASEDMFGNSPLHIACKSGSLTMTKLLVEAGAVQEAQNHAGKTPCDLAVVKRHKDIVEFLGGTMKKKRWYQRE